MQFQQLGNSDLHVSRIGFGCMSLQPGGASNETVLQKAFDLGINYYDTADLYDKGLNEVLVGKAFTGKRDKIVLATKVGNQWRDDGSGWDWNPRKEYILRAVEGSLQRLQTDYIDLYQLHGGTREDPIDETIEAFELLRQQGKIRYYGISSIRPNVIRQWVARSRLVSVMMQYSLFDRRPEESVFPLLVEKGISVLARESVAQGLLAGKAPKDYLNYSAQQVAAGQKTIQQLSKENCAPSRTALQFVLHHPAVASAVVGIRTEAHLEDAVKAIDSPPLTLQDMEVLRDSLPVNYYTDHR